MIKNIRLLRNIELFSSFSESNETVFNKLTLVYAENGRGKTTLSAIFRSLMSGDPIPIAERKSLSSQNLPHIVLDCEDATNQAVFQNNSWNRIYPDIRIFDDNFVHENIYSGLEVTSDHRQNLHQLIIGNQSVQLARRVEELTEEISRIQSELRTRTSSFSADMLGTLSVDDFCGLSQIQNIDEAIVQAEQRLTAMQQAETVRTTQHFEPFEPPTVDTSAIQSLLRLTLSLT